MEFLLGDAYKSKVTERIEGNMQYDNFFFIYNYSWNIVNKKKKGGKIMGLPPEPSKTCSFRKCNIPLLTIVVNCLKKIFKVQQMPKNKEKINENMHTCFH